MKLTLEWEIDGKSFKRDISGQRLTIIGRQPDCDIVLENTPTVSRKHAAIYVENGAFYLRNLSKTNIIRYNDEFKLNSGDSTKLEQGSKIRMGAVHIHVLNLEASEELHVECVQCGRAVPVHMKDCPWCGANLAFANTVYLK